MKKKERQTKNTQPHTNISRKNWLKNAKVRSRAKVVAVVLVLVGLSIYGISRAGANTAAFEAEGANPSSKITPVSDASASGGSAIKFGGVVQPPSGAFVHPGVLIGRAQIDFVRGKLAEPGTNTWKTQFSSVVSASPLSFTPSAKVEVKCDNFTNVEQGTGYQGIQQGCQEYLRDSQTAYANALIFAYKCGTAENAMALQHADKAREIFNAWSSTLTNFHYRTLIDGKYRYLQGALTTVWGAESLVRAAELIRYNNCGYNGWGQTDITRFEGMLKTKILPNVSGYATTNLNYFNWDGAFASTRINIGIFTNDRAIFDAGVAHWRDKIKKQIYKATEPNTIEGTASDWHAPKNFPSGMPTGTTQETCRDMSHSMMGFAGYANGAETARLQNVDLYSEEEERMIKGFELQAGYFKEYLNHTKQMNISLATGADANPSNFYLIAIEPNYPNMPATWMPSTNFACQRFVDRPPLFVVADNKFTPNNGDCRGGSLTSALGWEIAYNHYKNRKSKQMPNTTDVINMLEQARAVTYSSVNNSSSCPNITTATPTAQDKPISGLTGIPRRSGLHMVYEKLTNAGTP